MKIEANQFSLINYLESFAIIATYSYLYDHRP